MVPCANLMKTEIHFLDVGPAKFGDCILCRRGDDLILIAGGHPGEPTPQIIDNADDSGIVVVEKQGSLGSSKAMVFSRGLLKGKQG